MKTAKFLALMCVLWLIPQIVFAESIHIVGAKSQVESAIEFVNSKGVSDYTYEIYPEGVYGEFKNNEKWPGIWVFIYGNEPGEEMRHFIPISDKATREGLCEDQKRMLLEFSGVFEAKEKEEVVVKVPEIIPQPEVQEVVVVEEDVPLMVKPKHSFVFNIWDRGEATDNLMCDDPDAQSRDLHEEITEAESEGKAKRYTKPVTLIVRFFALADQSLMPKGGEVKKSFFRQYLEYKIVVKNGKYVLPAIPEAIGGGYMEVTSSDTKFRYPSTGKIFTLMRELRKFFEKGGTNANVHLAVR